MSCQEPEVKWYMDCAKNEWIPKEQLNWNCSSKETASLQTNASLVLLQSRLVVLHCNTMELTFGMNMNMEMAMPICHVKKKKKSVGELIVLTTNGFPMND